VGLAADAFVRHVVGDRCAAGDIDAPTVVVDATSVDAGDIAGDCGPAGEADDCVVWVAEGDVVDAGAELNEGTRLAASDVKLARMSMRAKPWEVPDGLWARIEPLLPKR